MLAISLALLLAGATAQDAPRLRTILPSGAVVLVERMPEARLVSIHLWASARGVAETPGTHGHRHLLEHLILKGPNQDLDKRLELRGIWMTGQTYRDAMQIELTCPPGEEDVALKALAEMLRPLETTEEQIAAELAVMREEFALVGDIRGLSTAAWRSAYAEGHALDPLGDLDAMSAATPASLRALQAAHFASEGLALVIAGPVDIDQMTKRAVALLAGVPKREQVQVAPRPPGVPNRLEAPEVFGEVRGAIVESYRQPSTAWALAAALAVASEFEQAFVTYTPSDQPGLVLVGRATENSGIGLRLDALDEADMARMYPIGRLLASRWVQRYLEDPRGVAYLRGLLLSQGVGHRPETLRDNALGMTFEQFKQGCQMLRRDQAVVAVGTR